MLATARLVAFAPTTDLDRAAHFYEHVLGLRLVEATPIALVFDVGGTPLRVTAVPEVVVAPYTVLGWLVDDVDATRRQLAERGVPLLRFDGLEQDAGGIWTAPGGDRIAWFTDPDGNVCSVTQPADRQDGAARG